MKLDKGPLWTKQWGIKHYQRGSMFYHLYRTDVILVYGIYYTIFTHHMLCHLCKTDIIFVHIWTLQNYFHSSKFGPQLPVTENRSDTTGTGQFDNLSICLSRLQIKYSIHKKKKDWKSERLKSWILNLKLWSVNIQIVKFKILNINQPICLRICSQVCG